MLNKIGAVSLVAMLLIGGTAMAQEEAAQPAAEEAAPAVEDAAPAAEEAAPVAEDAAPAPAVDVAAPAVPQEVLDILNDARPLADLNDGELRQRFRAARGLAKQQGLTDDVREQLQAAAAAARAEMDARVAAEKPAEPAVEQKAEEPAPAPAVEEPAVEQKAEEPAPAPAVEEKAEEPVVEPPVEQKAEEPVVEPPVEQKAEEPAPVAKPAAPKPAAADVQKLDANPVSAESEAKARKLLADKTPAASLPDRALKLRLNAMRDLMATNTLSPKTEKLLRIRLKAERDVLRSRQAEKTEEAAPEVAPATPGKPKPAVAAKPVITEKTPTRAVLADERSADELSPRELRRRLRVNRDVEVGAIEDVEPQRRELRRELIRRDREVLRRRMLEERRERTIELEREPVDIEIEEDFQPSNPVPRNVFEAEANDEEIEDILISAPKKRITQRYTVDEVAARSELRDVMPRIEIDTIRFGFNEAFVREEEVENLDRIAAIVERVLRKNPREVFLIEGHTDAVGSDAYNIGLSRARAEAVKRALTTYYVISERNLKTVGLGERYLKIPTSEPEGENRRVSISRATPLLGELR
jgi:outer membrane protein OmpA-like peptidoglycan-associated protein